MKSVILALIFLLASGLRARNVALTGVSTQDRTLADLVIGEAGDKIMFLERQSVDKILREQTLNSAFSDSHLARRFEQAQILAVLDNRRLTIFETQNGFRLRQRKVRSAHEVIVLLQEALTLDPSDGRNHIISVAAIRNNLHQNYREAANTITHQILSAVQELDAICLERDYLAELLLEKDISAAWGNAIAASEIIHFELNPGANPGEIEIGAYVSNAKGKIIEKWCGNSVDEIMAFLKKYLLTPFKNANFTLQDEAARFAFEGKVALMNSAPLTAIKKYFAAFALSGNEKYFCYNLPNINDKAVPKVYPYLEANCKQLMRDEKYSQDAMSCGHLAMYLAVIHRRYRYKFTPEQRQKFSDLLPQLRKRFFRAGEVERFMDIVPQYFSSPMEYRQSKNDQLRVLIDAVKSGMVSWNTFCDSNVIQALLTFQGELPPRERRKWTADLLAELRGIAVPELQVAIMAVECNSYLFTRECTVETAAERYRKLFELCRRYKLHGFYYVAYNLECYRGLSDVVKKMEKEYLL